MSTEDIKQHFIIINRTLPACTISTETTRRWGGGGDGVVEGWGADSEGEGEARGCEIACARVWMQGRGGIE